MAGERKAPALDLQKLPPQNLEAEQAVLGAILLEASTLNRVLEILGAEDFYRPAHRRIFEAVRALSDHSEAIDLVTLKERLQRSGELEAAGGAAYIASLLDGTPTVANVGHHARIVREKSVLRKLLETASQISGDVYDSGKDVKVLLDEAEKKIYAISEGHIGRDFYDIRTVVTESFSKIEQLYEKKELVTGVPTGFEKFDQLTSGLQSSDLVIIAGRPSMGKTSFCLNVAEHVAIETGQAVAIFSLEMSRIQLAMRLLCSQARVDSHRLRTGFLAKQDWPKLTIAASRLTAAPIYIDDTSSLSVLEIRAKSRRKAHELAKEGKKLALIIVDYLQLIRGGDQIENRQQEISDISRSLKALAKEIDVPVVALSQLSRAVEMRGKDKRPQLSDLRDSGSIEQDADVVAFIYREEVYSPEDENVKGVAEIIVRKQRNGPIDTVKIGFLNQYTKFVNLDPHHYDGGE